MNGLNRVTLIGNLGKEPECKTLDSGIKIAKVTLATNDRYLAKSGERITRTDWHNLIFWRGQADVVEKYTRKGSLIYVEGKLRHHTYKDKEGNTKYYTDIEVENFTLLDKSEQESTAPHQELTVVHDGTSVYNNADGDTDLPF